MTLQEHKEKVIAEFKTINKCIDSHCDGSGNIPHQVSEDEWEAQQCQYCAEIRFPLIDIFSKSLDSQLALVVDLIPIDTIPDDESTQHKQEWTNYNEGFNACRSELLKRLGK